MGQQQTEETAVQQTIIQFAAAADSQDAATLEQLLDADFRLTMNQLFGSNGLVMIDKTTYLSKIRSKEFGGDKRQVAIENVTIVKNNAMAKATFKGSKMTIVTMLQLIKTSEGKWKILNDLPMVE